MDKMASQQKDAEGFMLSISIQENDEIILKPYGFTCYDKHITFISLIEQLLPHNTAILHKGKYLSIWLFSIGPILN